MEEIEAREGMPREAMEDMVKDFEEIEPAQYATKQAENDYASLLNYILEIDIPDEYKEEFDKWKPALSRSLALGNIRRSDLPEYLNEFDLIISYYRIGQPRVARKKMARFLAKLMLSRSVDALERKMQVTQKMEKRYQMLGGEEEEGNKFWVF